MQTFSAVRTMRLLLKSRLETAGCIVDATAGNGCDTFYLAENSSVNACIYAFDIQEKALIAARHATECYQEKIRYILDSHVQIYDYVADEIDIAVFNLGYLPGGDHQQTTVADTTVVAVGAVLKKLSVNGILAVIAYPGHEAGYEENERISGYLQKLSASVFTVGFYSMLNHSKRSPVLYLIEKVRREE